MAIQDICFMTATEMVQQIKARRISVTEVMMAHLDRIHQINPALNAIVTLVEDQALEAARAADRELAAGRARGPLFGLPVAHKDLTETRGIRTTSGSPIFKDHIPDRDALVVERLKQAGAITVGKTNAPEFGAGSHTFNQVFGSTRNPYSLGKTCGGSSGGAAVALAAGMVPIADGSDLGGSLRNPAGYCNVVGFRTSTGRVPIWPKKAAWFPLSITGPMARTVEDAALMLSAIAGPDPRSPISLSEPGSLFRRPLERDFKGVRIAWSNDLGELPVDPAVLSVINGQRRTFETMGMTLTEADPDLTDANWIFKTYRAYSYYLNLHPLLEKHRDRIKETVVWNIECGARLTGPDLCRAEEKRTALYQRIREFMNTYEYLVLPVSQVPPFDIDVEYIKEINGVAMETYIDWMKSCYYITVTGLPAISVPCGFTEEGLPVGVQIVGRPWDDWGVLQLAYAFQQATGFWKHHPKITNPALDIPLSAKDSDCPRFQERRI